MRRVDVGARGLHVRLGGQQICRGVVVVLLRHGPALGQRLQAPLVGFGLAEPSQRDLELGLGLLQLRLELALVEREEQLVLLDDRALGEVLCREECLHPRANLHRLPGVRLCHELAVDRYRLLDDLGDHHRRRWRGNGCLLGLGILLRAIATCQRDGQSHDTQRRHEAQPRPGTRKPLQHDHLAFLPGGSDCRRTIRGVNHVLALHGALRASAITPGHRPRRGSHWGTTFQPAPGSNVVIFAPIAVEFLPRSFS